MVLSIIRDFFTGNLGFAARWLAAFNTNLSEPRPTSGQFLRAAFVKLRQLLGDGTRLALTDPVAVGLGRTRLASDHSGPLTDAAQGHFCIIISATTSCAGK